MIGSSKNNRENYPKIIHFWANEKGTRVKFNPGLSANNCPLNNWVLNLHLALTVGYLNPALNNSAQVYFMVSLPSIMIPCRSGLARGKLQGSQNPPPFFCAMALAIISRGMRVLLFNKMKRKSIEKALGNSMRDNEILNFLK